MQDWKAQQAARASAAAALQAAFPALVPAGSNALVAAAKNIRIELKQAFPAVKFSVKSERYSGGDSINVGWIDGPNGDQVEAIIKRYQGGHFDGMADIYNNERSAWRDAFGDAKYVFANRSYSDKAIASAIRTAVAVGLIEAGSASVEDYRKGRLYWAAASGFDIQSTVYQIACKRVWALAKKINQISEVEA